MGKALLPLEYLIPYFWLYYFTHTLVCRCNALPKKTPKRIIQKKRQKQIRDEDVFFYTFLYLLGSPVNEEVFPEYTEMIEFPS